MQVSAMYGLDKVGGAGHAAEAHMWSALPPVSCGSPPEVANAHTFGTRREEYPVNSILRYQCDPGFTQRQVPVVRCKADGLWEEPQVQCSPGERIYLYIKLQRVQ